MPSDLGRLVVAAWRHRTPLLVAGLVCGIAGGGAAWLRPGLWAGKVQLAIGNAPPAGKLQDPNELAKRLSSITQVYGLCGLEHCVVSDEDTELPPDCPQRLTLASEAIAETNLVTFSVETYNSELSSRITEQVTRRILAEHQKLFEEVEASNKRSIGEFERLLERLEADLARERTTTQAPVGDVETWGIWPQVVAVRRHLEGLRDRSLSANARPTRAVAGPEVERLPRMPNPPIAAILGAFAGVAIAGLSLAMRQAVERRA